MLGTVINLVLLCSSQMVCRTLWALRTGSCGKWPTVKWRDVDLLTAAVQYTSVVKLHRTALIAWGLGSSRARIKTCGQCTLPSSKSLDPGPREFRNRPWLPSKSKKNGLGPLSKRQGKAHGMAWPFEICVWCPPTTPVLVLTSITSRGEVKFISLAC